MPTFFHGTELKDAQAMAKNPGMIDVTIGGGEFGRGFYTQYSEHHALAWAIRVRHRLNGPPCVLRLDIDDNAYGNLKVLYLDAVSGPALTAYLEQMGQKYTYTDGTHDLIEGPVMGNTARMQQKFESQASQDLLNGPDTKRTIV